MNNWNRETMTLVILSIFASQLFVNVIVLILVFWKFVLVVRHLKWVREFLPEVKSLLMVSRDLLDITKQYAVLLADERKDTQKIVIREASHTQNKVDVKAEEIKKEIKTAASNAADGSNPPSQH